jgi:hypothetical protein
VKACAATGRVRPQRSPRPSTKDGRDRDGAGTPSPRRGTTAERERPGFPDLSRQTFGVWVSSP